MKTIIVKAVFCRNFREKSLKFHFYVCFLAALWLSGVPLYADENQITTSASECLSPYFYLINYYSSVLSTSSASTVATLEDSSTFLPSIEGNCIPANANTSSRGGTDFIIPEIKLAVEVFPSPF